MLPKMFSSPISSYTPYCCRANKGWACTPDRISVVSAFLQSLKSSRIRFSPVASIDSTLRILMMRILGAFSTICMASRNLLAAPKKNGPLNSKTSTPSGTLRVTMVLGSSSSSLSFRSFVITPTLESWAIRCMNRTTERSIPISMARVRSKTTVRPNVVRRTMTSLLGLFRSSWNTLISLMFQATMIRIAARDGIGMSFAHLPNKSMMRSRVMA